MPGVHIGDGVIVAVCSVVTKDVSLYTIVVGNPARLIHPRFDEQLTSYLLKLKWWDWSAEKIFVNMDALCSAAVNVLSHIGALRKTGRQGRLNLYKLTANCAG